MIRSPVRLLTGIRTRLIKNVQLGLRPQTETFFPYKMGPFDSFSPVPNSLPEARLTMNGCCAINGMPGDGVKERKRRGWDPSHILLRQ